MRSDGRPYKKAINSMRAEAERIALENGHKLIEWKTTTGMYPTDEYIYNMCPRCFCGISVNTQHIIMPKGCIPSEYVPGIHGDLITKKCKN